jgi:phosphate transport system substrate-binding protein
MGFVFAALGLNRSDHDAMLIVPRRRASTLHLAGSTTMRPLLEAIAAKYRLLHPEIAIEVEAGGSTRGLQAVRAGTAQIAMLSRALGPSERDLYGIPIARDGVGLIVHASSPLREAGIRQLQDIFTGIDGNWRVLGSVPDGASAALLARFLKQRPDALQFTARVESSLERLAMVAGCESAISYVSVGVAERTIAQGVSVRLLPVAGIAANSAHVRDGTYPICRELVLASKQAPAGVARSFFAFCLSEQVNGILSAFDFVPYLD